MPSGQLREIALTGRRFRRPQIMVDANRLCRMWDRYRVVSSIEMTLHKM